MQYILNGVKPHHFFPTEHLFERNDSTSRNWCVLCSVVFTRMEGHTVMSLLQPLTFEPCSSRAILEETNLSKPSYSSCSDLCQPMNNDSFQQWLHLGSALEQSWKWTCLVEAANKRAKTTLIPIPISFGVFWSWTLQSSKCRRHVLTSFAF